MKVVMCGSMSSAKKMVEIKDELEKNNHEVVLPVRTELFASGELSNQTSKESTEEKIKEDLIRDYYFKIKDCDAVLIVNVDKNAVENYIGGNAFLEMAFGHVLNKKIFLLNPIPEISYSDEIKAMQPVVLEGEIKNIK